METNAAERYGPWLAKRATIIIVVVVIWHAFVASPDAFGRAIDRTGAAYCEAFPCAENNENGQSDPAGLLPDPAGVWGGLEGIKSGVDGALDSTGFGVETEVDQ